jgi:hypothetical protein
VLGSLLVIVVGIVAGFMTYMVGTPLTKVIDNLIVGELSTALIPLVIGVVGNWIVLRIAKLQFSSRVALSLQSVALLAGPVYFGVTGNDYQMFAGLATGVLCIPAMLLMPLCTRRMLRNP